MLITTNVVCVHILARRIPPMTLRRPFIAFLIIALFAGYASLTATAGAAEEAPATARAGEEAPAADKSSYTLFNPTPLNLMRDLNPDRPDVTESPFTVDAGHY